MTGGASNKKNTRSASISQRVDTNKKKRDHHVNSIKRFYANVCNDGESVAKTPFELEDELASLSDAWTEYKLEYAKIFDEMLEDDESEQAEKIFVDTEKIYLSTRSKIRSRIAQITPAPVPNAQAMFNAQAPLTVELKQPDALANIQNTWGHFSGNYADWPAFRDSYKSRMHDRSDVLPTHKC